MSKPLDGSPSQLIDARIKELGDWRGKMLGRLRAIVKDADPDVVEEWKWRGVPVWSHAGIICTGETYKAVVKMTFAKGAALADPSRLFNFSLEGNTRRAIDFSATADLRHDGDKIDEKAFKTLIRAAVALNTSVRVPARTALRSTLRSTSRSASRSRFGFRSSSRLRVIVRLAARIGHKEKGPSPGDR